MAEKEDKVVLEREYVVNLRNRILYTPRYRRTPKAIKELKKFVARHMKVYDRDLRKIFIDRYLNEEIWFRGIQKPVVKLKIRAKKFESGIVRVELVDLPANLKFKKLREERAREKVSKVKETKKPEEAVEKETPEEKKVEVEKEKAVVEAGMKEAKLQATEIKHEVKMKHEPQRQVRKSLLK
ncbi:MAG: 50S ribosomal protein L31e [Candidatus Pacearchaeota archaeon]|nr:50S ribosomal protein L31e [Candidatus Pacearchaeota archaeon]